MTPTVKGFFPKGIVHIIVEITQYEVNGDMIIRF